MRVVTLLVAGLLVVATVALASGSFADPRGDAGDGPDITSVTLSHTSSTVTFAVTFASAPPLAFSESEGYTDMLLVGIHTDDDLSRADVEFWTGLHGVDLTDAMVVQGAGPDWRRVGAADVTVSGSTVELELERGLLGDPDEIAVQVAAGRESATEDAAGGAADEAPASGAYAYALEDGGTPSWLWPAVGAGAAALVAGALLVALRGHGRPHRVGTSH
ncbi:MAG TPA: hypothetical protein VD769_10720 [Gaiellaceae bacterium]|nr:hypothetical protein [Gaiellaceae bacterium]